MAFDSFRAAGMDSNVTQVSTTVRLRLTAAQMAILWPGLDLLARSYAARQLPGGIRYEYPFRMLSASCRIRPRPIRSGDDGQSARSMEDIA